MLPVGGLEFQASIQFLYIAFLFMMADVQTVCNDVFKHRAFSSISKKWIYLFAW